MLVSYQTSSKESERYRSSGIMVCVRHHHCRPHLGDADMKNNWFSWNIIVVANIILIVLGVMML